MHFILLMLACQGPLGDRHEITDNRIITVGVEPLGGPTGTLVEPTVVLALDGRLWSDRTPRLHWYWVEQSLNAVAALSLDDTPDGSGSSPTLQIPTDRRRLVLVADVETPALKAFLDLPETEIPTLEIDDLQITTIEGHTLTELTTSDLELTTRAGWTAAPSDTLNPGDILRFQVFTRSTETTLRTRWSATAPHGTFFELDSLRTDWVAGTLDIDGDDIEERLPLADEPLSIFSLLLGESSNTAYRITDLNLGAPTTGLRQEGRWIETDKAIPPDFDFVRGLLVSDDDAPTGLLLQEIEGLNATDLPTTDPYGVLALNCDHLSSEPFRLNWLAEHKCNRALVDGHTVVLRAR
jgi:hypothetical protein